MTKLSGTLLGELFADHADDMLSYIRGRFPGEDSADIVQEAFLRVLQYPNPEAIREPKSFLFQIANNVAVDYYRRTKTRDRFSDYDAEIEALENFTATPEQASDNAQRLELFTVWLDNQPELQRHAFVLFRIEGYSHKEIAAKLNISVRCSERYVQQALRHLVSYLEDIDNNRG
ncbi:hypothetical protein MCAMS1_00694 [biofilm metagenome]